MYDFFYDLATYANTNWAKGSFTQKEVASNAYAYTEECKCCNENHITDTIQTLLDNLMDDMIDARTNNDIDEEATFYYNKLIDYIKGNANVDLNDLRMEIQEGWT